MLKMHLKFRLVILALCLILLSPWKSFSYRMEAWEHKNPQNYDLRDPLNNNFVIWGAITIYEAEEHIFRSWSTTTQIINVIACYGGKFISWEGDLDTNAVKIPTKIELKWEVMVVSASLPFQPRPSGLPIRYRIECCDPESYFWEVKERDFYITFKRHVDSGSSILLPEGYEIYTADACKVEFWNGRRLLTVRDQGEFTVKAYKRSEYGR